MKRLSRAILIVSVMLLLLPGCATAPVSGPSTEEGNPQVVAFVIDSLEKPVPGAIVTAYRMPQAIDTLQPPSSAAVIAERTTDVSGKCTFDILPGGSYALEATDPSSSFGALSPGIAIMDSTSCFTDTLILARPGGVTGVVSRGGVPGVAANRNTNLADAAIMVIIQEIGRSFITPQTGEYSFPALPPGTYTIMYYATDGFFSAKRPAVVKAGILTTIETVILTPIPRLLPPRAFTLHHNKTTGGSDTIETVLLTWEHLVFDSLRWYEVERIDLEGPFDTVFTAVDTFVIDTINGIPPGTTLNYVVRSVDRAFNRSANAGPLEVVVE